MTQNGAFWLGLILARFERCFGNWNCREKSERIYPLRCILTLFETMFLKLVMLRKNCKQGVNSNNICKNVVKVGTAEKIWKQARILDGAFWGYLKQCWNCWEKNEIMDDRWCILALFEVMFLKFELLRTFKSNDSK